MKNIFFLLPILCFLSACGTIRVISQVEGYSSMPPVVVDKRVIVKPTKGQKTNSISWKTVKRTLSNELRTKGLSVANSSSKADYIVYFGYAIDEGELVTTNYSVPQYGVTGYSSANTFGSFYGSSYSSTTTLNPTYGITGYTTGSRTDNVFTRSANLSIIDKKSGEMVFEAMASSKGSCHSFIPVAPMIISALLEDFPNGKIGKVVNTVPSEEFNC